VTKEADRAPVAFHGITVCPENVRTQVADPIALGLSVAPSESRAWSA
jgi:hypothetical protein